MFGMTLLFSLYDNMLTSHNLTRVKNKSKDDIFFRQISYMRDIFADPKISLFGLYPIIVFNFRHGHGFESSFGHFFRLFQVCFAQFVNNSSSNGVTQDVNGRAESTRQRLRDFKSEMLRS